MFIIIEIILISLIAASAAGYFIWHLRKELKGDYSCGNLCESCKIKESCSELKLPVKPGKKVITTCENIFKK
jgi:hypothetical protein